MIAIHIDDEKYLKSYSFTHQTPKSILVVSIPDENDPEKLSCYKYNEGEFVFDAAKWATIQEKRIEEETERAAMAEIEAKRAEINVLKATLEESDYKIIKCQEYALNGLELPYDIKSLHLERQTLRDQINELETTLQK